MNNYEFTDSMSDRINASYRELARISSQTTWDKRAYVEAIHGAIRKAVQGLPPLLETFKTAHFPEDLLKIKVHISNELDTYYVYIENNLRSFGESTDLKNVCETIKQVLNSALKDAYTQRKSDLMG